MSDSEIKVGDAFIDPRWDPALYRFVVELVSDYAVVLGVYDVNGKQRWPEIRCVDKTDKMFSDEWRVPNFDTGGAK